MHVWKPSRVYRLRMLFSETQEEFARRLRVSIGTVREWEQGRTKASGIVTLALEFLEREKLAEKIGSN